MSSARKPPSRRDFKQLRRTQEREILDQLPEVDADSFILTWEFSPGTRSWIVKYGERVLYREPALHEDYHRFELLARIVRGKYGERVRDLVPVSTPDSDFYLYGDYLGSVERVEAARKRTFGLGDGKQAPRG
jgi:hypothetical protein